MTPQASAVNTTFSGYEISAFLSASPYLLPRCLMSLGSFPPLINLLNPSFRLQVVRNPQGASRGFGFVTYRFDTSFSPVLNTLLYDLPFT